MSARVQNFKASKPSAPPVNRYPPALLSENETSKAVAIHQDEEMSQDPNAAPSQPGVCNQAPLDESQSMFIDGSQEKTAANTSDTSVGYLRTVADSKDSWSTDPRYTDETDFHYYLRRTATVCKTIADSRYFQDFITFAIVVASALVGIQTYEEMENLSVLTLLDEIILYIFTIECVIKIAACYNQPWLFFYDRWNQFDFAVVFVCYMPVDASMVTILRLARLLRVLKLVKALPELQVLVMGLLGSLSSIMYVALLLMLVFYLYAVLCITLFRDNDPVHFPNLETTFLTLFRMATFEDWTDIMYTQMFGCDVYKLPFRTHMCTNPQALNWLPAVLFISFLVLSSFVVLNLFIGVITSNMDEARNQLKLEKEELARDENNKAEVVLDREELRLNRVTQRMNFLIGNCSAIQDELALMQEEIREIVEEHKNQKRRSAKEKEFAANDDHSANC